MKKTISFLLALCLMVAFAACSKSAAPENTTAAPATQAATEEAPTQSGKTLVVYFSATGSTKAVAETLAKTLGADLYAITPKDAYTSADLNWRDSNSRVCKEHDDVSLQTVELTDPTPAGWTDYTTVLIGYPIWWGGAAWPVTSFVKANDFSGKTVIPYCTSASSELGSSATDLQAAAKGGNWQEGKRFASGAEEKDVQTWAKSLNIQ